MHVCMVIVLYIGIIIVCRTHNSDLALDQHFIHELWKGVNTGFQCKTTYRTGSGRRDRDNRSVQPTDGNHRYGISTINHSIDKQLYLS